MSTLLPLVAGAGVLAASVYSERLAVEWKVLPEGFDDPSRGIFSEAYAKATHPGLKAELGLYVGPIVSVALYVAYEVGRMCAVHLGAFLLLTGLRPIWKPLKSPKTRSILSRGAMNVCFLGSCGWQGLMMWRAFAAEADLPDAPSSLAEAVDLMKGAPGALTRLSAELQRTSGPPSLAFVPGDPVARLYAFMPSFQRLSAVMAAFQLKNLADTAYYGDGALFFLHHVICVVVAAWAMYPFAHFHGTFFFGVSETSTTLLALLANFDKTYGVPALEADFPKTRKIVGALFAVSFVLVRAVLWPYFTYFFVNDCLYILDHDLAHDKPVVIGMVTCLATLSVMQVIWLGQIFHAIYSEFFASKPSKAA